MKKVMETYGIPKKLESGEDGVRTFVNIASNSGYHVVEHANHPSYAVYASKSDFKVLGIVSTDFDNPRVSVHSLDSEFHRFVSELELK